MRPFLTLAALTFVPLSAFAQPADTPRATPGDLGPPLTAEQFDARTQGRTITYSANGQPYGVEQYKPGHKVIWAFTESECKDGTWFQSGEHICFDYGDFVPLQCWTFYDTSAGLVARFMGDPASEPLVSLSESDAPLSCQGPDIGV